MDSFFNSIRSNLILQAIVLILFGAVLLAVPGITVLSIVYVSAFMIFIFGAFEVVTYAKARRDIEEGQSIDRSPLIAGIIMLIVPFIMFILPQFIEGVVSILIGLLLVLSGALNCQRSFQIKRTGYNDWMISMVLSVVIIVLGVLLICNPFESAYLFIQIFGISLIFNGVADLLLLFWSKKTNPSA